MVRKACSFCSSIRIREYRCMKLLCSSLYIGLESDETKIICVIFEQKVLVAIVGVYQLRHTGKQRGSITIACLIEEFFVLHSIELVWAGLKAAFHCAIQNHGSRTTKSSCRENCRKCSLMPSLNDAPAPNINDWFKVFISFTMVLVPCFRWNKKLEYRSNFQHFSNSIIA